MSYGRVMSTIVFIGGWTWIAGPQPRRDGRPSRTGRGPLDTTVGSVGSQGSADGGEAPERGADVLDAAGLDAEHAPRGALRLGMGKLLHAEEVEISDEALVVAIDDVLSEHDSMVLPGNSSAQAS